MQGARHARQLFEDPGDGRRRDSLLFHGEAHMADRTAVSGQDIDLPLAWPGCAFGGVEAKAVLAPARDLNRHALLGLPALAGLKPLPVMHDAGVEPARRKNSIVEIELGPRLDVEDGAGAEQRLPLRRLLLDTGLEIGAI